MKDETVRQLVDAARAAAGGAFAPYSRYRVGAALLTAEGELVSGANVENASYGLSMCAERTAVFAAVSRGLVGPDRPLGAVCIHAPSGPVPWPCGACRQVLSEFAGASLPVLVDGIEGTFRTTLGELLPHAFRLESP
jgi:homotetrameric cytidine deaminase